MCESKSNRRITSTLVIALISLIFTSMAQSTSRLDKIRQRGFLNCGVHSSMPGFSIHSEQGWVGFEADFCRALAAATLGDANQVRFVPLPLSQGYNELQSGDIDLLMRHNRWSMKQDTALGITFVAPWFFEQQGFLLQIASQINQIKDLKGIRICVSPENDKRTNPLDFFVQENHFPSFGIAAKAFENGQCDALSGTVSQLHITQAGFSAGSKMLVITNPSTLQALGPIVRHQDHQWFKIVRWTIYLLINAESANINRQTNNSSDIKSPSHKLIADAGLNGISLGLNENWAAQVTMQLGNYGEIFQRSLGVYNIPRGINVSTLEGGLHLLPPME